MVGAIWGNCDIGSCFIAKDPINTIIIEITIANTGLCINRLNIVLLNFTWYRDLSDDY